MSVFSQRYPPPYNAFNIDLGGTGVNDVDVALIKMSVIFYQTGPGEDINDMWTIPLQNNKMRGGNGRRR